MATLKAGWILDIKRMTYGERDMIHIYGNATEALAPVLRRNNTAVLDRQLDRGNGVNQIPRTVTMFTDPEAVAWTDGPHR